ncbi:MAG: hypothetical protein H6R07_361 [Proteobacteria bacterium]|nr:hypothetical protein [Pseudomonadota bacterium]
MSMTYRQATVSAFVRMLTNLSGILDKGAEYAHSKKFDESILLNSRLYPDMYPLLKQVQVATDMAKFCVARLTGEEAPRFADDETSFAQLKERIANTIAFIAGVSDAAFAGAADREIILPWMPDKPMKGEFYVLHFAQPNVYFHLTMAYAILRHNGVPLGKMDFIGPL